jgi:hypothetical protein
MSYFKSLKVSGQKKGKACFVLKKFRRGGEIEIGKEKGLKMNLSIVNNRRITRDKEKQLKAIN